MKTNLTLITIAILLTACEPSQNSKTSNLSHDLVGNEIRYVYSGGNEYVVKLEQDGLSYQFKTGSKPEKWWGKFEYHHMTTHNGEHLISWHEPDYGDYVTLLINFEKRILYGSAIIKNKIVHFQEAKILTLKTKQNI